MSGAPDIRLKSRSGNAIWNDIPEQYHQLILTLLKTYLLAQQVNSPITVSQVTLLPDNHSVKVIYCQHQSEQEETVTLSLEAHLAIAQELKWPQLQSQHAKEREELDAEAKVLEKQAAEEQAVFAEAKARQAFLMSRPSERKLEKEILELRRRVVQKTLPTTSTFKEEALLAKREGLHELESELNSAFQQLQMKHRELEGEQLQEKTHQQVLNNQAVEIEKDLASEREELAKHKENLERAYSCLQVHLEKKCQIEPIEQGDAALLAECRETAERLELMVSASGTRIDIDEEHSLETVITFHKSQYDKCLRDYQNAQAQIFSLQEKQKTNKQQQAALKTRGTGNDKKIEALVSEMEQLQTRRKWIHHEIEEASPSHSLFLSKQRRERMPEEQKLATLQKQLGWLRAESKEQARHRRMARAHDQHQLSSQKNLFAMRDLDRRVRLIMQQHTVIQLAPRELFLHAMWKADESLCEALRKQLYSVCKEQVFNVVAPQTEARRDCVRVILKSQDESEMLMQLESGIQRFSSVLKVTDTQRANQNFCERLKNACTYVRAHAERTLNPLAFRAYCLLLENQKAISTEVFPILENCCREFSAGRISLLSFIALFQAHARQNTRINERIYLRLQIDDFLSPFLQQAFSNLGELEAKQTLTADLPLMLLCEDAENVDSIDAESSQFVAQVLPEQLRNSRDKIYQCGLSFITDSERQCLDFVRDHLVRYPHIERLFFEVEDAIAVVQLQEILIGIEVGGVVMVQSPNIHFFEPYVQRMVTWIPQQFPEASFFKVLTELFCCDSRLARAPQMHDLKIGAVKSQLSVDINHSARVVEIAERSCGEMDHELYPEIPGITANDLARWDGLTQFVREYLYHGCVQPLYTPDIFLTTLVKFSNYVREGSMFAAVYQRMNQLINDETSELKTIDAIRARFVLATQNWLRQIEIEMLRYRPELVANVLLESLGKDSAFVRVCDEMEMVIEEQQKQEMNVRFCMLIAKLYCQFRHREPEFLKQYFGETGELHQLTERFALCDWSEHNVLDQLSKAVIHQERDAAMRLLEQENVTAGLDKFAEQYGPDGIAIVLLGKYFKILSKEFTQLSVVQEALKNSLQQEIQRYVLMRNVRDLCDRYLPGCARSQLLEYYIEGARDFISHAVAEAFMADIEGLFAGDRYDAIVNIYQYYRRDGSFSAVLASFDIDLFGWIKDRMQQFVFTEIKKAIAAGDVKFVQAVTLPVSDFVRMLATFDLSEAQLLAYMTASVLAFIESEKQVAQEDTEDASSSGVTSVGEKEKVDVDAVEGAEEEASLLEGEARVSVADQSPNGDLVEADDDVVDDGLQDMRILPPQAKITARYKQRIKQVKRSWHAENVINLFWELPFLYEDREEIRRCYSGLLPLVPTAGLEESEEIQQLYIALVRLGSFNAIYPHLSDYQIDLIRRQHIPAISVFRERPERLLLVLCENATKALSNEQTERGLLSLMQDNTRTAIGLVNYWLESVLPVLRILQIQKPFLRKKQYTAKIEQLFSNQTLLKELDQHLDINFSSYLFELFLQQLKEELSRCVHDLVDPAELAVSLNRARSLVRLLPEEDGQDQPLKILLSEEPWTEARAKEFKSVGKRCEEFVEADDAQRYHLIAGLGWLRSPMMPAAFDVICNHEERKRFVEKSVKLEKFDTAKAFVAYFCFAEEKVRHDTFISNAQLAKSEATYLLEQYLLPDEKHGHSAQVERPQLLRNLLMREPEDCVRERDLARLQNIRGFCQQYFQLPVMRELFKHAAQVKAQYEGLNESQPVNFYELQIAGAVWNMLATEEEIAKNQHYIVQQKERVYRALNVVAPMFRHLAAMEPAMLRERFNSVWPAIAATLAFGDAKTQQEMMRFLTALEYRYFTQRATCKISSGRVALKYSFGSCALAYQLYQARLWDISVNFGPDDCFQALSTFSVADEMHSRLINAYQQVCILSRVDQSLAERLQSSISELKRCATQQNLELSLSIYFNALFCEQEEEQEVFLNDFLDTFAQLPRLMMFDGLDTSPDAVERVCDEVTAAIDFAERSAQLTGDEPSECVRRVSLIAQLLERPAALHTCVTIKSLALELDIFLQMSAISVEWPLEISQLLGTFLERMAQRENMSPDLCATLKRCYVRTFSKVPAIPAEQVVTFTEWRDDFDRAIQQQRARENLLNLLQALPETATGDVGVDEILAKASLVPDITKDNVDRAVEALSAEDVKSILLTVDPGYKNSRLQALLAFLSCVSGQSVSKFGGTYLNTFRSTDPNQYTSYQKASYYLGIIMRLLKGMLKKEGLLSEQQVRRVNALCYYISDSAIMKGADKYSVQRLVLDPFVAAIFHKRAVNKMLLITSLQFVDYLGLRNMGAQMLAHVLWFLGINNECYLAADLVEMHRAEPQFRALLDCVCEYRLVPLPDEIPEEESARYVCVVNALLLQYRNLLDEMCCPDNDEEWLAFQRWVEKMRMPLQRSGMHFWSRSQIVNLDPAWLARAYTLAATQQAQEQSRSNSSSPGVKGSR